MLVQYIRQGNRLIGAVVATDADKIGWSVCCDKERVIDKDGEPIRVRPDKFSKSVAVAIAKQRAEDTAEHTMEYLTTKAPRRWEKVEMPIPSFGKTPRCKLVKIDVVETTLAEVSQRAKHYFKQIRG